MLTSDDIIQLARNGEGYNAEFKYRVPKKVRELAEEVCAFSNLVGGYMILGIDDNNNIKGVNVSNTMRSSIQSVIREISPTVSYDMYPVAVGEKSVWVIDVSQGKSKPYTFSGAIYMREGSNTQKLTKVEEIRDFFQQSECIFFDEIPCRKFDMKRDLDVEFVSEFKMMAGYHQEISNEHLFNNLKLYTDDGHFKNGGVLFFGKRPDDLLDSAFVRCAMFDGTDKRYIEDDKRMYGPLFRQYEQALAWLKKHLKVRYDIEGQGGRPRKEIWEIPEAVLKEALVNALAHRDYYDKGARIIVELFDDRLVVTNPGGLLSSIPPEQFGTVSRSRNPLVFGLMERIRMVEYIGSGVMRMRKAMTEAALPQPDFGLKGMFSITLLKQSDFVAEPMPADNVTVNDTVNSTVNGLSDIQNRALGLIVENNAITSEELGKALAVTSRQAQRIFKQLRDAGYIERDGSDKKGIWIIKNKDVVVNNENVVVNNENVVVNDENVVVNNENVVVNVAMSY